MPHQNCSVSGCGKRIPSNARQVFTTAAPEIWDKIVKLGMPLSHGVPICEPCRAKIRREFVLQSISSQWEYNDPTEPMPSTSAALRTSSNPLQEQQAVAYSSRELVKGTKRKLAGDEACPSGSNNHNANDDLLWKTLRPDPEVCSSQSSTNSSRASSPLLKSVEMQDKIWRTFRPLKEECELEDVNNLSEVSLPISSSQYSVGGFSQLATAVQSNCHVGASKSVEPTSAEYVASDTPNDDYSMGNSFEDYSEEIVLADTQYSGMTSDSTESPEPAQSATKKSRATERVSMDGFRFAPRTQSVCFVCHQKTRTRVPAYAITTLLVQDKIYVPKSNRCCRLHLTEIETFTPAAKAEITRSSALSSSFTSEDFSSCLKRVIGHFQNQNGLIDFDSGLLTDKQYKFLTGVEKSSFDVILGTIRNHLHSSKNRSQRNALGIFLMKIRTNVTNEMLSFLFQMPIQRISDTIKAVVVLLNQHFVPSFLGYRHITRLEARKKHVPDFVSNLYHADPTSLVLILDGTYLYVEKSQDYESQKATYSMQKSRNLIKPMMVICPDGYIIETEGPYMGSSSNNDANILNSMLMEEDGISSFIERADIFVLDRGFRDSKTHLTKLGIATYMPPFLKPSQKQFTTEEANISRKVTLTRWAVEGVNGRIKHVFPFFSQVIHNSYIYNGKLKMMWRIACSILNAFFEPLYADLAKHEFIVDAVEERMALNNGLRTLVLRKNWDKRNISRWEKISQERVLNFPRLSEQDIFQITLGCFQLKNAPQYTRVHLETNPNYELFVNSEEPNLLCSKIKSRFQSTLDHLVWIRYNPELSGPKAVTEYYCSCKSGSRTLGCCSHIASVVWFLGYFRHTEQQIKKKGFVEFLKSASS